MQSMRRADAVSAQPGKRPSYDLSALRGAWINVNPATRAIARVDVSVEGDRAAIRVHAIGPDGLIPWGPHGEVAAFASSPTATAAVGFETTFDLGTVETRLQGNLNKGLLVLAVYNRFKDGSGRVSYFTREYYSCVGDRYPLDALPARKD